MTVFKLSLGSTPIITAWIGPLVYHKGSKQWKIGSFWKKGIKITLEKTSTTEELC